jgi:hypothetical protein
MRSKIILFLLVAMGLVVTTNVSWAAVIFELQDFSATNVGSTSATDNWTAPFANNPGNFDGGTAYAQPTVGGVTVTADISCASQTSALFSGLTPNTEYNTWVYINGHAGMDEITYAASAAFTTLAGGGGGDNPPPGPPPFTPSDPPLPCTGPNCQGQSWGWYFNSQNGPTGPINPGTYFEQLNQGPLGNQEPSSFMQIQNVGNNLRPIASINCWDKSWRTKIGDGDWSPWSYAPANSTGSSEPWYARLNLQNIHSGTVPITVQCGKDWSTLQTSDPWYYHYDQGLAQAYPENIYYSHPFDAFTTSNTTNGELAYDSLANQEIGRAHV